MFGEHPSGWFHKAAYIGTQCRSESVTPTFQWSGCEPIKRAEPDLLVVAAHTAARVALVVVLQFLIHPFSNGSFHAESRCWDPGPDVFPNRGDVRIGEDFHATVRVVFKHALLCPRFRNSGQAVVPWLKEARNQKLLLKTKTLFISA